MSKLSLRPAAAADAPRLVEFNCAMAAETEGKQLDPARVLRGVEAVFADPGRGAYWVAERDGRLLGSLMLTSEWSDWRAGCFWWIQSVYVVPEARRQGIYRRLHQQVLERARRAPEVCGLRLYVERENASARRVYEALGMQATPYRLYEVDFAADEA